VPDSATSGEAAQAPVVAFLSDPENHDGQQVEVIRTHASVVFLTADHAYKMKRAVRYPYLDYSTLDRRQHFCAEEVALNRRTAPSIYLGVQAVTRMTDGGMALGGTGAPVEWLVHMTRFDDRLLLDRVAKDGGLATVVCRDLADEIFNFHQQAEIVNSADLTHALASVMAGNNEELRQFTPALFDVAKVDALARGCAELLDAHGREIAARVRDGRVRDCHGDLHLRNVVLIDGHPVLFDGIEFDPALRQIDTLYDLAFLIMDLLHRNLGDNANKVLNRYLDRSGDVVGLALLPFYLSQRAAIRAHTTARAADGDPALVREATAYLDLAASVVRGAQPRLLAIGGLSGSGKSTAAQAIAPEIGRPPGAIVLRSDAIRKRLAGVMPETTLPPLAYTAESSQAVYKAMLDNARTTLEAGYSVVADAVFGREEEARAFQDLADETGVPFDGVWLSAPEEVLRRRVTRRGHDASDADASVVDFQLEQLGSPGGWWQIDASGGAAETQAALRRALNLASGT
jgi:aminoglycoside phosphotransferase family enzyme/predicted kinase